MTGDPAPQRRRVLLLGATGSIGTQTLEVAAHLNDLHAKGRWPTRYDVVGLASGRDTPALRALARRTGAADIAVCGPLAAEPWEGGVRLRRGPDAAERLVREVPADLVVCAVVGIAGLPATLAAVELGRAVALANKEALVAGGAAVAAAAARSGAAILPIDSEHSALWQCLPPNGGAGLQTGQGGGVGLQTGHGRGAGLQTGQGGGDGLRTGPPALHDRRTPPMLSPSTVARAIITASGGPFRARSAAEVRDATAREALNHPTWSMGPKVTIDSATLMNKALELVEAHWLFGLGAERLGVLIHPQSIVHAIVETTDGQAFAQLAAPDMRAPIQTALTFPGRAPGACRRLDWASLSRLDFAEPDLGRWPALALGFEAIRAGGTFGAAMNAANEVAVEAFLAGRLPFGRITEVVELAARSVASPGDPVLPAVLEADRAARVVAAGLLPG